MRLYSLRIDTLGRDGVLKYARLQRSEYKNAQIKYRAFYLPYDGCISPSLLYVRRHQSISYRDVQGADNELSLFAIMGQEEGFANFRQLVRDLRMILRKSQPTHRPSGRPLFPPITANKNSSFLPHF